MKINMLAASDGTPIAKQYKKEGDALVTTPYPFVRNFDSFEYEINTPEELLEVLQTHAAHGHCLLKGHLTRPLDNESRAGSTNALAETQWAVFDYDSATGFTNIQAMIDKIDDAFKTVSYVLHHSSSSGIKGEAGLRSHVMILFNTPIAPNLLKQWIIKLNLTMPELREQITLSKSGMTLKFPLDVSTCQNDKLIFVADPKCHNFSDPMKGQRFKLIRKDANHADPDLSGISAQWNRDEQDTIITGLRKKQGLKTRKPKYKLEAGMDVLENPDRVTVTGTKEARGFTYLNLNDGDSWGYYHNTERPDLLYNFKGEPAVRLKAIAPDYFASLKQVQESATAELIPFVFREPHRDAYYNGLYNPANKTFDLLETVGSKDKIKDFLAQHDKCAPDFIEDWTLEFDPRSNEVFSARNKWVNRFSPTEFMKLEKQASVPPNAPMIIGKVLRHICVDTETYERFLNWLAYIFQTRQKAGTAWIFHGVPGTGKGILHEKILVPLLGKLHCPKITIANLEDQYNMYMETALLLNIDEAKIPAGKFDKTFDILKHIVTEVTTTIRAMRVNPYTVTSYMNVIITTNHNDPIPVPTTDRRFNIAPAQEQPLKITQTEIDFIQEELEIFAHYLLNYRYDIQKVRSVLTSSARQQMIEASETTVDTIFRSFRAGDLDFFMGYMRERPTVSPNNSYIEYERAVKRWAANANEAIFITRDEMMAAYQYLLSANITPTKFSRICTIQRVDITPGKLSGRSVRGYRTIMKSNDTDTIKTITEPNITGVLTG